MSVTLFKNIGAIIQSHLKAPLLQKGNAMAQLQTCEDAWLAIENDKIVEFGSMKDWESIKGKYPESATVIDVEGKFILPAFCDSHTHIVYAGSRENEFVYKIKGMSYEDIAKQGGGIINSAKKLQNTSEDELFENAQKRINEMIKMGTGAIEIKSGYGLTTGG